MTLAELRTLLAVLPVDVTQVTLPVAIVRELASVSAAAPVMPEELLTPEEAAARLGVTVDWLYRRTRVLPFARKLSRRVVRYSAPGLAAYLTQRDGAA